MEKKRIMLELLERIYVPVGKVDEYSELCRFIHDPATILRPIQKADEGRSRVPLLVIYVRGRGARETFEGFGIVNADFNKVGAHYAEAYLRPQFQETGTPQRLFVKSNKNAVIEYL